MILFETIFRIMSRRLQRQRVRRYHTLPRGWATARTMGTTASKCVYLYPCRIDRRAQKKSGHQATLSLTLPSRCPTIS